jgi:DNA polymerase-3 subunit delta
MKLSGGRIDAFLKRPDASVGAVLIYGPNAGLVSERAEALAQKIADPKDPFQVSELAGAALQKDPQRLADEAAAMSLTGARRLVRVRGAGDGQTQLFRALLEDGPPAAFLLVEAGDLGPRSSLRGLFEGQPQAGALPCYADEGQGLEALIAATLSGAQLILDGDARDYLLAYLGEDRILIRNELEKLIVYLGADAAGGALPAGRGPVTLEEVAACIGDSAQLSLEEIAFAVGEGDGKALERSLARAFREGIGPVPVLRAAARHLARLHLVTGEIAAGRDEKAAIDGLKPRVFFKAAPAFRRQLRRWDPARLAGAIELLTRAEIECKTTGLPAQAVCGHALMRIAGGARAP